MVSRTWYTQNEDYPQINDKSELEYEDGVLTVTCNDDVKSYKVEGPAVTKDDLASVEEAYGKEALCPSDPNYVLELLGLTLVEKL